MALDSDRNAELALSYLKTHTKEENETNVCASYLLVTATRADVPFSNYEGLFVSSVTVHVHILVLNMNVPIQLL